MTIFAHQTSAYGQWRAVVMLAVGREVEDWGITELEATRRAQTKATQKPCAGCGRGVNGGEAAVCRAARIPVLCASCREGRRPGGWYDPSHPER